MGTNDKREFWEDEEDDGTGTATGTISDPTDLTQYDDDFEAAEVPEGLSGDSVPDGKYRIAVDTVEFKTSKTGNVYLGWQMTVLAGPHKGRKIFHRNMLGSKENLSFLKKDLHTCGMTDIRKLSELQSRLPDLLDIVLDVQVKTKGEFQNVYLNARVEEQSSTTPSTKAPAHKTATAPPRAAAPVQKPAQQAAQKSAANPKSAAALNKF
jgi:hypothetical protein